MNELFEILMEPEVDFRVQFFLLLENRISIYLKINNRKELDSIFLTIFPKSDKTEARLLK